ncbi:hypothetical protein CIHG_02788 [Coccidioides immitis H538.4]|uniref:Uncharacterized protein n=3 Tax=Coccidioides immitis TaxID=5501 RepID=A0A0J8QGX8_COCIT|nr:hypothetical protein CIRG_07504 [Coccidioides immitis RMSCC 2394]KMU71716.1 hypothetical protein CISG_00026 [Coccidioides immitis RMSCC 3703]KMU85005.1 hypothetical protein CIHG_02788 [Coccidioides immitis H538.4]
MKQTRSMQHLASPAMQLKKRGFASVSSLGNLQPAWLSPFSLSPKLPGFEYTGFLSVHTVLYEQATPGWSGIRFLMVAFANPIVETLQEKLRHLPSSFLNAISKSVSDLTVAIHASRQASRKEERRTIREEDSERSAPEAS